MEHLPPWLRNVPLPPRPASDDTPDWLRDAASSASPTLGTPPAQPAPESDDDTPDWLRELQSEIGPAPTGDTDLPGMPPRSDAEDTPDWLRNVEATSPTAPARPEPFGATGWLQGLSTPSDSASTPEPPPEPPPTTTTSRIRMPVGATDWLRSIGQEPDPADPKAPRRPMSEMIDDKSGVPDWLRDVSPADMEQVSSSEPDATAPPSQTVFDPLASNWLIDDPGIAQNDSTVSADWAGDISARAETIAADDVPDWLRDVAPVSFDPPADQGRSRDPGSLPDWLSGSDSADSPEPIAGTSVPDWLRDVSDADAAPDAAVPSWLDSPSSTTPAADAGVPDWLRGSETAAPAAASARDVPSPAPPVDEDVPAWLRDAEERPTPAPAQTSGDEDVPAWLRDAEERPTPAPAQTSGDEDVPAWLRDAEERPTPAPAQTSGDEDVPAWLRDAVTTSGNAAEASPAASAPAPASDVPDWLRDAAGPSADSGEPANTPAQTAPQDLPPWLAVASSEPTASSGSPAAGDMSLPSWLRGVADEPPPARTPARSQKPDDMASQSRRRVSTSEDAEGDDFFKGAELPGWLRPLEVEQPTGSPEGQALDWLTRLGAADEGEGEVGVSGAQPAVKVAPPARRMYQRSTEQMTAVALLGQLVRSPYPAPIAPPIPVLLPRWQRIGLERVLYALLAIMLLVGLLIPQITSPFQSVAPTSPGAAGLEQQLASLGPDDVVMIAYEWDAQRSAELRPLEQAVTSQLIGHKTKLILLSTDLQGTLLSFDLRGPLRAAGYNIDPDGKVFGGRDYVLLGYRPGGELALRLLSQNLRAELGSDFEGRDATGGLVATNLDGSPRVSQIADLSMIIVLADQPQDVQVWMEQVHSAAPAVPIAFLMPQEADPLVQPYIHLPNVYHLAGLQGALALSALTAGTDSGAIARATGQQSLAVLTFVILLIGGGLGLALARARRSRRGAA